jgi:methionyl-tRNA formyltransferase
MRIVFFGSPAVALPAFEQILRAGHIIELVITQPDRPAGRGRQPTPPPVKELALKHGIPILQPQKIRTDSETFSTLKKINPEINVVVAYGQMIPDTIIYLPRFHSINVHFSLLPRHRGAAPVQWAILSGDEKTGVTIFELNSKMDEGDILSVEEVSILPRENAGELEIRMSAAGAGLLVRSLEQIQALPRRPQDHSRASLAPRLKKEQGKIDWTKEAAAIDRMVRAFSPWPGAYTFLRGQRIIIHAGSALAGSASCQWSGRVIKIEKQGPVVGCGGESSFLIERLQRENKKELDAPSFLRGMKINAGDVFE